MSIKDPFLHVATIGDIDREKAEQEQVHQWLMENNPAYAIRA